MGKKYKDENDQFVYTKFNNYSLKNLKILKDLKGNTFGDLSEKQRDKIYDFDINVI